MNREPDKDGKAHVGNERFDGKIKDHYFHGFCKDVFSNIQCILHLHARKIKS